MKRWVVATLKMERPASAEKVAAFLEKLLVFPCLLGPSGLYRQAMRL